MTSERILQYAILARVTGQDISTSVCDNIDQLGLGVKNIQGIVYD